MHHLHQRISLFIFILFFTFCRSQSPVLRHIDSITGNYYLKGNIEGAFTYNLSELKRHKKTGNKEAVIFIYINLAEQLYSFGRYKDCIVYLDLAREELKGIKDPFLYSRLYCTYGENYFLLGLYNESNQCFNKALKYSRTLKNSRLKNDIEYTIYKNKWLNYDHLKKYDSAYQMRRKVFKITPAHPELYTAVAQRYLDRKLHSDSAEYFLNQALLVADNRFPERKADIFLTFGNLYRIKKQYEKSLFYYFKSVDIRKKMKHADMEKLRDAYQDISESYKALHEKDKATRYYNLYSYLNDSISNNEKKGLAYVVDQLAEEKEDEKNKKSILYLITFFVVIASIGLFYFIRKIHKKKNKNTDKLIMEKEIDIEKKSVETEQLKKRLDHSLYKLAKNRDPFFLKRFQETYPEFCRKLMNMGTEITDHDLKICAYIKLHLTTNEIAALENITPRSVDTKKYRIKKKIGLDPKENFVKWIHDLEIDL